jgi:photosystem II stability/assembly factor-like uncharacterized protein
MFLNISISPQKNSGLKIRTTALAFVGLVVLIFYCLVFFDVKPALAHSPHDDIEELAVSPTYSQDKTLFVIIRQNLFKSSDDGKSWQRIVKGLNNKFKLNSLTFSPQNKNILYLASAGDGIYKSLDSGNSWLEANGGLNNLRINLIAAVSENTVLAVVGEKELYKTNDGGENWKQIIIDETQKITALASASRDNNYLVFGDDRGHVYISNDGGESWKQCHNFKNKYAVTKIAISPNFSSDRTFYVGTNGGGIFRTVDGGLSFSEVNGGLSDKTIMSLAFSPNYEGDKTIFASTWKDGFFILKNEKNPVWQQYKEGLTKNGQANRKTCSNHLDCPRPHFSKLAISNRFSQDQTIFLAGFNGLFKSINGGKAWSEIETLSSQIIVGLDISPDYMKDSTIAFSTYLGGAYLSKDGGKNWEDINSGLEDLNRYLNRPHDINRLFSIVFSPNYGSDETIFTSAWNTFFISKNRGRTWTNSNSLRTAKASEDSEVSGSFFIVVSPNFASDRTIYLGDINGSILESTDGGFNFSRIGNVAHPLYSLVISPNFTSDRTLYAGTYENVYKTVDGGKTWLSTSSNTLWGENISEVNIGWQNPVNLAISPSYKTDGTVLAGTERGLFITENKGKSWRKLSKKTYGEDASIEAIAISPNYEKDKTFIISVEGRGLFKTVDSGNTFTEIGRDLTNQQNLLLNLKLFFGKAVPLKFSPSYAIDRTIYGYSDKQLLKSIDGGETWESLKLPSSANKTALTHWYFRFRLFMNSLNFVSGKKIIAIIILLLGSSIGYLLFRYLKLKKKFI